MYVWYVTVLYIRVQYYRIYCRSIADAITGANVAATTTFIAVAAAAAYDAVAAAIVVAAIVADATAADAIGGRVFV